MTAIAWAIMFIGLIFYAAIWNDKLIAIDYDKVVGHFTFFCLAMLVLCTIMELTK